MISILIQTFDSFTPIYWKDIKGFSSLTALTPGPTSPCPYPPLSPLLHPQSLHFPPTTTTPTILETAGHRTCHYCLEPHLQYVNVVCTVAFRNLSLTHLRLLYSLTTTDNYFIVSPDEYELVDQNLYQLTIKEIDDKLLWELAIDVDNDLSNLFQYKTRWKSTYGAEVVMINTENTENTKYYLNDTSCRVDGQPLLWW